MIVNQAPTLRSTDGTDALVGAVFRAAAAARRRWTGGTGLLLDRRVDCRCFGVRPAGVEPVHPVEVGQLEVDTAPGAIVAQATRPVNAGRALADSVLDPTLGSLTDPLSLWLGQRVCLPRATSGVAPSG